MIVMEGPVGLGPVLAPGTQVKCITILDHEIVGEVAAFDIGKKALVLVSKPTDGSGHKNNTIHLLNIEKLKDLKPLKQPSENYEPPTLLSLDSQKLTKRVREKVNEKMALVNCIGIGVTPEAQALFNTIKKTLDDVKWEGKTIVVMGDIYIKEPYRVEDITTRGRESGVDHISKIVKKHYEGAKS